MQTRILYFGIVLSLVLSFGSCNQQAKHSEPNQTEQSNIIQQLNEFAPQRKGLKVPGTDKKPEKAGCTDSAAGNYDIDATIDDGSCWYYAED